MIGNVVLKVREDVFAAVIHNDLSFFDQHPSGKIVSRVTSDTQDFSDVVTLTMNLVSQVLLVVILSVWLFSINVWLTLLLLAMTPLAVAMALSFRRIARQVTQHARRVTAKINAQIQESVSGIMVAKGFRQEQAIYTTFLNNNRQAFRVGLRRGLTLNTIFPVLGLAAGVGVATLLYAGGLATRSGLSPGDWYLFMQAVGFYWWPLTNIASFWSQFQDGLSAAERAFALIDAEPKVVQTAAEPVDRLHGRGRVPAPAADLHRYGGGAGRLLPEDPAPGDGGAGGPHRGRQEQRGAADRPLLRVPGGRAAGRWPGHPSPGPGPVPPPHRRRAAGAVPLFRYGTRQHPLRPPRCDGRARYARRR